MPASSNRRAFIQFLGGATAASASQPFWGFGRPATAQEVEVTVATETVLSTSGENEPRILKSLKWGMVGGDLTATEKFSMLKDIGFDGVELDSPGGLDVATAIAASKESGLPVDGTVDSTHWQIRLTDSDVAQREKGLADLLTALRETHAVGGSSVLLVPGHGRDGKPEVIHDRSLQMIRRALPTAARLGVHILIENVWNEMFYDPQGDNQQSADALAQFIDAANSPWVGVQFDIGNHQKFARPADWIRTLGRRIVKLDVKDWSKADGFGCKIGDGDVDWADVRSALNEIEFTGWAAAEVSGGEREQLADIAQRMVEVLGIG